MLLLRNSVSPITSPTYSRTKEPVNSSSSAKLSDGGVTRQDNSAKARLTLCYTLWSPNSPSFIICHVLLQGFAPFAFLHRTIRTSARGKLLIKRLIKTVREEITKQKLMRKNKARKKWMLSICCYNALLTLISQWFLVKFPRNHIQSAKRNSLKHGSHENNAQCLVMLLWMLLLVSYRAWKI